MTDEEIYNPLDKRNLGRSVAEALLLRPLVPLAEVKRFHGAGVYAIYYSGSFGAYQAISLSKAGLANARPIYVGKAEPSGSRKGLEETGAPVGTVLFKRLLEHRESINQVSNLEAKDFSCRWLVVDDIWIPLGESLLIVKFRPIWNSLVDGFGNHDPGKGRYQGLRPRWDLLHPGRPWAAKCAERPESAEAVAIEVERQLAF